MNDNPTVPPRSTKWDSGAIKPQAGMNRRLNFWSIADSELLTTGRHFLTTFIKYSRKDVVFALGLIIISSLTNGISLLMIVPFLDIVGLTGAAGANSGLVKSINALVAKSGLTLSLPIALSIYVGLYSLTSVGQYSLSLLMSRIKNGFTRDLRNAVYEAIMFANWGHVARSKLSSNTAVLTAEIDRIGNGTHHFLQLSSNLMLTVAHLAIALVISPLMTTITVVIALILILVLWPQQRKISTGGKTMHDVKQDFYSAIIEQLSGMKLSKSYGVETSHLKQFNRLCGGICDEFVRYARISSGIQLLLKISSVLALSLLVYLAFAVVSMSTPELLLFILVFSRTLPRFSQLQQSFQQVLYMLPAYNGVRKLKDEMENARDAQRDGVGLPIKLRHSIELRNVSFRYGSKNRRNALSSIDLYIPAGAITAIIGKSGAGKSTLADLLMGLLYPDSGEIIVDAVALQRQGLPDWRRQIGYVPQSTFLFNDTIRANLLWALPEANDTRLWQVLKMAAAAEFVNRLEGGLDTIVGDRGGYLSGGERQRIALARALLREPSLLILDEATSALDLESEYHINKAIQTLREKMTIIIIAHRLSTIRNAEHVIILDNGVVKETGDWENLARRQYGYLHELISSETGASENVNHSPLLPPESVSLR